MNQQREIELSPARSIDNTLFNELAPFALGAATAILLTLLLVGIGWTLTLLGA